MEFESDDNSDDGIGEMALTILASLRRARRRVEKKVRGIENGQPKTESDVEMKSPLQSNGISRPTTGGKTLAAIQYLLD